MSAWETLPRLGAGVGHDAQEGIRQALLQNPVFGYQVFEPVNANPAVSVSAASTDIAETTTPLGVVLPSNTSAVLYYVFIQSGATGSGSVLILRHKPGGNDIGAIACQTLGKPAYGQLVAQSPSGEVTYRALKGSATSYDFFIVPAGFFRSY